MRILRIRFPVEPVVIGALAFFAAAVHLLPFMRGGAHPLGYDTGFYRRYLIEPWSGFPNPVVPGLGDDAFFVRILLDFARALGTPTDIALYGLHALAFILLPLLFYTLLKPALGVRGAAFGAILLIMSPVAYTAYWYFLLKNAVALCLLLAAFIALERRALVPALAFGLAIALSHTTTAILYLATLAVSAFMTPRRAKEFALHASLVLLALFAAAMPAIEVAVHAPPVAVFIGWGDYLRLSIPFIVAVIAGLGALRALPLPMQLIALFAAAAAFPVLGLPFYERVFVFVDLALAGFAAAGIEYIFRHVSVRSMRGLASLAVLFVVAGSLAGSWWHQVKALGPLVSEAEISRITSIGATVPEDATILTTTDEAPWFEGWTNAHIAAPGMLNDIHDYEAWERFWNATSTREHLDFLNEYPSPLYISTAQDYSSIASTTCATPFATNLIRYSCRQ